MSQSQSMRVICSACGQVQNVHVWLAVNVTNEPELKEKIRSGDLFVMKCAKCAAKNFMSYPFIYHDEEKEFLLYLVPKDTEIAKIDLMDNVSEYIKKHVNFYSYTTRYRTRIVTNRIDLNEKALIFENGYDDHIIEISKFLLERLMMQQVPGFPKIYHSNYTRENDREYILMILNDSTMKCPFSRTIYDAIHAKYKEEVFDLIEFEEIDKVWAIKTLAQKVNKTEVS